VSLLSHYDLVFIGYHPASLLSAILATRLGFSVLILPIFPIAELRFSSGPKRQYLDPEINWILGFGQPPHLNGLIAEMLSLLGLNLSNIPLSQESPLLQVIHSKVRFVFSKTPQIFSEINREFGEIGTLSSEFSSTLDSLLCKFLVFWKDFAQQLHHHLVHKSSNFDCDFKKIENELKTIFKKETKQWSFWKKFKISQLQKKLHQESLKALVQGFCYGVTSHIHSDPCMLECFHLFALSQTAVAFPGGMSAYRLFLLDLARELGAHVPNGATCKRVFIEKKKFIGLQVSGHGGMIGIHGAAILGCTLKRINHIAIDMKKRKFEPVQHSLTPVGWRLTIALSVNACAIPSTLERRMIWQEEDESSLEFEQADFCDYVHLQGEQKKGKILYLRKILPYLSQTLCPQYQHAIGLKMLKQATQILPFLEEHILQTYPGLQQWEECYGFKSLDAIPDNLLVFSGKGLGISSGIQRLFLASEESYPTLGGLGPILASLQSIQGVKPPTILT